jgi:hypothetical protein
MISGAMTDISHRYEQKIATSFSMGSLFISSEICGHYRDLYCPL